MKLWAVVVLACTISSFSFADTSTNSFKTPIKFTIDSNINAQKSSFFPFKALKRGKNIFRLTGNEI